MTLGSIQSQFVILSAWFKMSKNNGKGNAKGNNKPNRNSKNESWKAGSLNFLANFLKRKVSF